MRILQCEGYKMFEGDGIITPKNPEIKPFTINGVWLYRPDTDCWYCDGRSFSKDIVKIQED